MRFLFFLPHRGIMRPRRFPRLLCLFLYLYIFSPAWADEPERYFGQGGYVPVKAEESSVQNTSTHFVPTTLATTTFKPSDSSVVPARNNTVATFLDKAPDALEQDAVEEENYQSHIRMLSFEEKYDELDRIGNALLANGERFAGGRWKIDAFFEGLTSDFNLDKQRLIQEDGLQKFGKWERMYPRSIIARTALVEVYLNLAWRVRGRGWYEQVPPDKMTNFKQIIGTAKELAKLTLSMNPNNPYLLRLLIDIYRVADPSSPDEDTPGSVEYFEQGIKRQPLYFALYETMAINYIPRWGGELGDLERFAAVAADRTKAEMGDAMYAIIAHYMLWVMGDVDFGREFQFSKERIRKGIQDYLRLYPNSFYYYNGFAHLASAVDDLETAKTLFLVLKGRGSRLGGYLVFKNVWMRAEFLEHYEKSTGEEYK